MEAEVQRRLERLEKKSERHLALIEKITVQVGNIINLLEKLTKKLSYLWH